MNPFGLKSGRDSVRLESADLASLLAGGSLPLPPTTSTGATVTTTTTLPTTNPASTHDKVERRDDEAVVSSHEGGSYNVVGTSVPTLYGTKSLPTTPLKYNVGSNSSGLLILPSQRMTLPPNLNNVSLPSSGFGFGSTSSTSSPFSMEPKIEKKMPPIEIEMNWLDKEEYCAGTHNNLISSPFVFHLPLLSSAVICCFLLSYVVVVTHRSTLLSQKKCCLITSKSLIASVPIESTAIRRCCHISFQVFNSFKYRTNQCIASSFIPHSSSPSTFFLLFFLTKISHCFDDASLTHPMFSLLSPPVFIYIGGSAPLTSNYIYSNKVFIYSLLL